MPTKLQFTPKTIGALVALAVLVVVLWALASKSSDSTIQLNQEVQVNFTPNSTSADLPMNIDHEAIFRQALNEAKFIFKAPSDGTYSANLKNANMPGAHDIDLFGYEDDKVPVPSSNFFNRYSYANTEGNILISESELGGLPSDESGTFALSKDQKVVIIAFPWWVKSSPTNVSLVVRKI
jgi:hypothetical protein